MIRYPELISIVLFSSIAIALLRFVFRDNTAVLRLDVRFLLGCMLLVALRLAVPVEMPFSNNIAVRRFYPEIHMFLTRPLFHIGSFGVHILLFPVAVWLIKAVQEIAQVINTYRETGRDIKKYTPVEDPRFLRAADAISAECRRRNRFRLVTAEDVYTPSIYGVVRPYIMIPPGEYEGNDVYFVLKHEMLHYYRGDMAVRMLCELLRAVYWWNPLIKDLGRLMVNMQEVRVDLAIMRGLPEGEKLDYSGCLVRVAMEREKHKAGNCWLAGLGNETSRDLQRRVNLMLQNTEPSRGKVQASILLAAVVLCFSLVCPNVFSFEPYAITEAAKNDSINGEDGEFYFIDNKDGTYDLYIDGQNYGTVSELFDEEIPVYDD